ncbi:MAG: hypothetical protein LBI17_01305 [Rickettsiales bacterium]|jgi:hypothetical protein|nr:hypothetical protein [Rickettsiales bacterium]
MNINVIRTWQNDDQPKPSDYKTVKVNKDFPVKERLRAYRTKLTNRIDKLRHETLDVHCAGCGRDPLASGYPVCEHKECFAWRDNARYHSLLATRRNLAKSRG